MDYKFHNHYHTARGQGRQRLGVLKGLAKQLSLVHPSFLKINSNIGNYTTIFILIVMR